MTIYMIKLSEPKGGEPSIYDVVSTDIKAIRSRAFMMAVRTHKSLLVISEQPASGRVEEKQYGEVSADYHAVTWLSLSPKTYGIVYKLNPDGTLGDRIYENRKPTTAKANSGRRL
jgi:hypothetical protein